mmetsp:Transcript_27194/g.63297  ORF Transcript_27194/g.63297 Transcript_27194/m.63297 type:complete len:935 (-) Transcript_27194:41-2845(-)
MAIIDSQGIIGGLRQGSLVEISSDAGLGQVVDYSREASTFTVASLDQGSLVTAAAPQVGVPKDLGKPGQGGSAHSFDVFKGPCTSMDFLTQELDNCMVEKGFCVVRTSHNTDVLAGALASMQMLGEESLLSRLPEEVEEGYLGIGGKGKVVWLDSENAALKASDSLTSLQDELSELAEAYQPYSMDTLGQLLAERSLALASLSLVGLDEEEYPYPIADDKALGDFLQMWRRSLLRAVLFLGPGQAEVTLTKKDDLAENLPLDVEEVKVVCPPNTLLVYMPSRYQYSIETVPNEEVLALTVCYLSAGPVFELMPYECDPKLLSNLASGPSPPGAPEVSVVACSARLAGGLDDADQFRWCMDMGGDTVIEIPYMRYNIYDYWAPDPNDLGSDGIRTQLHRHQSYVDAVELFDHKFFDIPALEAGAMSPMQRQVLECGSDLLYQVGITKKIANKNIHHAGVSVGLDKDDYPTMNVPVRANGNNVIAIISNRFSFIFNLRGPNYVCDTACSAALCATHYARLGMLNVKHDPQEFHVAMGCHMLLKPRPGASSMFSKVGRCFTFDNTADGYLPGEGTSGIILKPGPMPDERLALLRSSGVGQNGRSATLTAPNGPAQEQLIVRVMKEGGFEAAEATAWECHGTGTSLGDPIEMGSVRRIMVKANRQEPLMVGSDKSNMGHMEGGAAMAGMIKCVHQVSSGCTLPTLHLRVLNAHMETFDAIYMTETVGFYYLNGHSEISSFGFGGTNGHMVFWGESLVRIPDAKTAVMKRIKGMAPPEVRPIGADPDQWDSDFWDANWKPDDKYTIAFNPSDPVGVPMTWLKVETAEEAVLEEETFAITGNFNEWAADDFMVEGELPGVFIANVIIPDDGFAEFRFLVHGEVEAAIGPDTTKCARKLPPSVGPAEDVTTSWMVKGTPGEEIQVELLARSGRKMVTWVRR